MAYSIELGGRTIFLAAKAETPAGDYIVYEWNDGIFIPQDEDEDWDEFDDGVMDMEDLSENDDEDLLDEDDDSQLFEDDEDYDLLDEEEDEIETAIREDMETIIASGFVPQGGVAALITPEYTTCYSQAFFRKK